jgi:CDP-diacylglycerol--serine O-phosphatidyltransferase
MARRLTRSVVPNLLTLANLFSGFVSIIYASHHDYQQAAIFIFLGALFDMFDGITARLINAASEFGVELDSLCDVVTFGVAPSYLLYQAAFGAGGELGILFAAFPALAGATRLARFNVTLTSLEDKSYFIGLPIPSGALVIISYVIFIQQSSVYNKEVIYYLNYIVPALVALVMISNIKFDNMPRPTKKYIKAKPFFTIIFIIALILVIWSKGSYLFSLMFFWIVFSSVKHFLKWLLSKRNPEEDLSDEGDDTYSQQYDID